MIGSRLVQIRGSKSQTVAARELDVHKNTHARWERGEAEIGAEALRCLVRQGFNANWLLTGDGPQRIAGTPEDGVNLKMVQRACNDTSRPLPRAVVVINTTENITILTGTRVDALQAFLQAVCVDLP